MKHTKFIFTNVIRSYGGALKSQKQYLIDVLHAEMKELEPQLRKELSLTDEENVPSQ